MDLEISGTNTGRQTAKSKRKSKRSLLGSKRSSQLAARPELKPTIQRVFLYLQLKNILNLPVAAYPLELHLYQAKNTLQKMSEHYTKEMIIYQHEFNMDRPVFAMGIIQDSLEDMNMFCDNPLIVTLYQRIPRHRKGQLIKVSKVLTGASLADEQQKNTLMAAAKSPTESETADEESAKNSDLEAGHEAAAFEGDEEDGNVEYVDESLEFVSRGHCDLLQLFQAKRFINNIPIMLYPEYHLNLETHTAQKITTTSEWHMYSILPTLKTLHFTNLAFITLESIFNVSEELHERADQLGMNLLIRSTKSDEDDYYKFIMPLCTFYSFGSHVIDKQNIVIVWENIKRDLLNSGRQGIAVNQMDTNMHIQVQRIFQNLLMTEGVDFKLHAIDPMVDKALINNSLHRYVLTPEMELILEAAVVHNDYQLLLQLYDEDPLNVLYEGVLNLSVFGYPSVNACRFAAELLPPISRSTKMSSRQSPYEELHLPIFAIVNLCFFKPLTVCNEALDTYNESNLKAAKLRRCLPIVSVANLNKLDILKEQYRNFDEIMRGLISYIIKNDVTSIKEKPNYFCCCLANLRNLLVKICGNDFNVRFPTKTNVEFREMLTHMHKELMERVVRVLKDCGMETLGNCVLHNDNQHRMRRLMGEYRDMCMVGNSALARQVFAEIKSDCENKMLFNFYVFLNSVEMLDFNRAKYYLLHQKESNWKGEYFVDILEIYIDYQVELQSEEQPGEAFNSMIVKVRSFAKTHSLDSEGWILLYCFYKQNNYLPGMEYTRWNFENRYNVPARKMPIRPCPLFQMFMPEEFNTLSKSQRIVRFYEVFLLFANLGAYAFAETVYEHISDEFTPVETYLVKTTLKILQGQIDQTFTVKKFPSDNTPNGVKMSLFQAHINGNAEYSRGRYNDAIAEFKALLGIHPLDVDMLSLFRMSLMRMGRMCFDRGDYELSTWAYQLALPIDKSTKDFMVNYGMGVSLYYLNRLEESIVYLARSTQADVFMPDPWGFLATINLRLDRNKTALNCWKVAKMYPEISMDNRIYAELEKINYSDVYLLAEDNCKPP